ncbi:hypothetical protein GCM10022258_24910 [Aquimarina gracilis]
MWLFLFTSNVEFQKMKLGHCIFDSMSRKYKFHNKRGLYFVSFATVYWIDVFTRQLYFDVLADSINTYSGLVSELTNEFHTSGIHQGKISRSKLGLNIGFTAAYLVGVEANFKAGIIIPGKDDSKLK